MICRVPDCQNTNILAREVCKSCYHMASWYVGNRGVSWDELEAAGIVGKAGKQVSHAPRNTMTRVPPKVAREEAAEPERSYAPPDKKKIKEEVAKLIEYAKRRRQ